MGRLTVHARGFGFVDLGPSEVEALPGLGDSVFVGARDLAGFLAGDRVRVTCSKSKDGRFSAKRLELLERTRSEVLGEVVGSGRRRQLKLDPGLTAGDPWPLGGKPGRAGDVVLAEVGADGRLKATEVVPPEDVSRLRTLVRWGIPRDFPREVEAAAKKARPRKASRRDLTGVPTLTIDAAHSKDLDDALAVLPAQPDGAVRVLVSIADVDSCAPAGSLLAEEARRRGTSVYLPDQTLPMFPKSLSERKMSLLPGAERPTLTVELRIDVQGRVTSTDIYESTIKSAGRLTYTAAAAFLDEGQTEGVPEPLRQPLRWLRTAAARLATARAGRGGVNVFREEAKLTLDQDTREPKAIGVYPDTTAHRLVERLMVAANEAVARWLVERGLPGVFRVHPSPEPDRIARLAEVAGNFGIEAGFGPSLSPLGLAAFEEQLRDSSVASALRTVLRGLLGPARYTVQPGLHFGLGAPLYLHFTSPIRRYSDLLVHRIVKSYLRGTRSLVAGDEALEQEAVRLNERARNATKAEAERLRSLVARLFRDRIGERYQGNVVGVKTFGLIVQLTGTGVTATLASEQLPGGPWKVDPDTESLVSKGRGRRQGRRRYRVGDPVEVAIAAVDETLGRVDLSLRK